VSEPVEGTPCPCEGEACSFGTGGGNECGLNRPLVCSGGVWKSARPAQCGGGAGQGGNDASSQD
jgi:hypothetical protein